jgi:hypothetical protein
MVTHPVFRGRARPTRGTSGRGPPQSAGRWRATADLQLEGAVPLLLADRNEGIEAPALVQIDQRGPSRTVGKTHERAQQRWSEAIALEGGVDRVEVGHERRDVSAVVADQEPGVTEGVLGALDLWARRLRPAALVRHRPPLPMRPLPRAGSTPTRGRSASSPARIPG